MLDTSFKISLFNINNMMTDTDGVVASKRYPDFPMQEAEASNKPEAVSHNAVFKPNPTIPLFLDKKTQDGGWSGDELYLISNQAAYDGSDQPEVAQVRGEPASDLGKNLRNFTLRLYNDVADKVKGLVERRVYPVYDLDGDNKLQMYELLLMDLNKDGYIDNAELDKIDTYFIKKGKHLQLKDIKD